MISSLVVETVAERTTAVAEALTELAGVEVHERQGDRLVVTIEAPTVEAGYAVAAEIPGIEGVIGTNLVYANFEDDVAD